MSLLTEKIKELISIESGKSNSGYQNGSKRAICIAVCSQKGGVGKTTTTVNFSASLAHFHKKKVLVIDLDPQGHVEKSVGAIIPEGVEYLPLSTIMTSKKGNILDGVINTELPNFFLTPGDKALYEAENVLASKIGKEFILDHALKTARTLYDFIIFDCPPNLGNLTVNALVTADYCLIPCEMSVLAFEGVNDLVDTIETVNERLNKSLKILGVVFTRVDHRNINMNTVIEENMRRYFRGKVMKTQISINTALNKAQLDGRPVFMTELSSTGSKNYQELADEIIRKLKRASHPALIHNEKKDDSKSLASA